MARDYKNRSRRRRSRKTGSPSPWQWLAVGLLVGLFVAFLVYLQMRPQQQAPRSSVIPLEKPAERETRKPAKAEQQEAPPAKPRFDFYNLLPEMEVIVPEQEITGDASQEGVKQVEEPGTYLLQAGSFRNRQQAEQLRAKLGLMGLETSIQTISVNNKQSWHRVRVGPFSNLRDLNQARTLLRKYGIDAILIRLKG